MSFLSQSDIVKLIECEICQQKYGLNDKPQIIPCGKTACAKCIAKIDVQMSEFKCPDETCGEEHTIPKNGFPINKKIAELITTIQAKRIPITKSLELNLDFIKGLVTEINADLEDGSTKLKKHCLELRRDVMITTEEKIKDINELSVSLIKIINDYENECLQKFSKTKKYKESLQVMISNANKFVEERKEYLKQLEISEGEILLSNELAKEYRFYLDGQKKIIESLIFDNKIMEFKANLSKLSEMSIGFICSKEMEQQFPADELSEKITLKKINKQDQVKTCEKFLVSGSWDSSIRVWDPKTEECLQTLEGHDGIVFCLLVISRDILISGASDEKIKIWNLKNGECSKTLIGHSSSVICLQQVPGEYPAETLISGSWDKTVRIWNFKKGKLLNTLTGHQNGVMNIQVISKDTLISASGDSTIKIWNFENGHCLKTLHGHTDGVSCLMILNKDVLISGSNDNTLKIWDLKKKEINTLEGHTNSVFCFESISKEVIVSGAADGMIKIWNIEKYECISTFEAHESIVFCLKVVEKDDIVISGSYDATIKVWNWKTTDCLCVLEGHSSSIHCMELLDDDKLVSASADNTIKIWSFKTGECLSTLEGHSHYLSSLKLFVNTEQK
jgi:WD40 repeat protein